MQIFLCPETNVTIHAQRLMPSRNTCALIQERSLLVATNVIFPERRQVTSRYIFEPTQVGSLSCVISATILPLKLNISRHTEARPFTCNQCRYSYNRSDSMKRHMLSHTGEMPSACKQRNYSCTRSTLLKTHMMRKHCPNKKFIGFPHISQKFLLHPAGISFDE